MLAPPLAAVAGAKPDFGGKVAEHVRAEMDRMPTHAAFDGRELRDALRKYGLKEDELAAQECAQARQLAGLLAIPLVMCGRYEAMEQGMRVTSSFISPGTGDSLAIDPFVATRPEETAQRIVREFERNVQGLSSTLCCQRDVDSQQWSSAARALRQRARGEPERQDGALSEGDRAMAARFARGGAGRVRAGAGTRPDARGRRTRTRASLRRTWSGATSRAATSRSSSRSIRAMRRRARRSRTTSRRRRPGGQPADAIAMYEVAADFAEDAKSTAMVSFFHG